MKKIIELKNISKSFDDQVVLDHINLDIYDNEFITLLGPSGCGKTTTLRIIGGFETPDTGDVIFMGENINDLPPYKRNVNTVFQRYALFPHLNVFENVAFSLREKKMPKDEINRRVTEMLALVALKGFEKRAVTSLSGGQQQRVAIARALVTEPAIICMDEPLSNLDAKLRNQMRAEIILLRQKLNTTFIYVTHDQTEAMTLGDRIVIMHDGYIEQVGTPMEVFEMPRNVFVAEFIGAPKMNLMQTELVKEGGKYYVCPFGAKILVTGDKADGLAQKGIGSRKVLLGVRPEHIVLADQPGPDAIPCKLEVNEMMGSELHLHVYTADETRLIVRVPTINLSLDQRKELKYGKELYITFEGKVMHFFDPETTKNLIYD